MEEETRRRWFCTNPDITMLALFLIYSGLYTLPWDRKSQHYGTKENEKSLGLRPKSTVNALLLQSGGTYRRED